MLFRIIGGKKGIGAYLKYGRKRGREQTRDELDQRVVLLGDLAMVEQAVGLSTKKGERYLHVTISFLEDDLAIDVLREICIETQRFLRTAYQDDELLCYAEAHLPRIKSLPTKGTKEEVSRKPHIHFVVPMINLLTGKTANPLGKVKTNIVYINALQETLNARFGLASPQDHRRKGFENGATVVERHNEDGFTGARRQLKQLILGTILEKDFRNFGQLRPFLATLGEVTLRNAGTDRAYLNLKLPGEPKGINLKDYPFSTDFLSLSSEDKKAWLATDQQTDGLVSAGPPRPPKPEHEKSLVHWHELRAREVKYLNPGNTTQWEAYHKMSKEEKLNYIGKLETVFYAKAAGGSVEAAGPAPAIEPDPVPSGRKVQDASALFVNISDSRLGHLVLAEVRATLDSVYLPRLSKAPVELKAATLRQVLGKGPLELPEKYDGLLNDAVSQGPQGLYRVLRGQLQREPGQAWATLVKMGLATHRDQFRFPAREASDFLWKTYLKRKAELQKLERSRKQVELSLLQMSLVLSRKLLWAQSQPTPSFERSSPQFARENSISAAPGSPVSPVTQTQPFQTFDALGWTHDVMSSGEVQYLRQEEPILRDVGRKLLVQQCDSEALEITLRLAVVKFGKQLDAQGDQEFQEGLVVAASRLNLGITFADPEMQLMLEHLQQPETVKSMPVQQKSRGSDWEY